MSRRSLFLALASTLAACGGGLRGVGDDAPGILACKDVCEAQATSCEGFDQASCDGVCDAYGITITTETCDALFQAYNDCLAGQTWTCFDGFAAPDDVDACAAEEAAFDDGC